MNLVNALSQDVVEYIISFLLVFVEYYNVDLLILLSRQKIDFCNHLHLYVYYYRPFLKNSTRLPLLFQKYKHIWTFCCEPLKPFLKPYHHLHLFRICIHEKCFQSNPIYLHKNLECKDIILQSNISFSDLSNLKKKWKLQQCRYSFSEAINSQPIHWEKIHLMYVVFESLRQTQNIPFTCDHLILSQNHFHPVELVPHIPNVNQKTTTFIFYRVSKNLIYFYPFHTPIFIQFSQIQPYNIMEYIILDQVKVVAMKCSHYKRKTKSFSYKKKSFFITMENNTCYLYKDEKEFLQFKLCICPNEFLYNSFPLKFY